MTIRAFVVFLLVITLYIITLISLSYSLAQKHNPLIDVKLIATGLANPRGVVVLSTSELIVVEAGEGALQTGKISKFTDFDNNRFFSEDEIDVIASNFPSYNGLRVFGTGHDEVGGLSDIILVENQLYFTRDNPNTISIADDMINDIRVQELSLEGKLGKTVISRGATLNSLDYDQNTNTFYIIESGFNTLISVNREDGKSNEFEYVTAFPQLAHKQQAVPAGIALDPSTGDAIVALFSGQHYLAKEVRSYVPGDAKVVRVNLETGELIDEVIGLTTVVDVAVDALGAIYILEHTTGEALEQLARAHPLTSTTAAPLTGGYPRKSGRLSKYTPATRQLEILVEHLDAPTNITYYKSQEGESSLYISTGQGTPNRTVTDPDARLMTIVGELYLVTGFDLHQ